jgi:hypothetical protein
VSAVILVSLAGICSCATWLPGEDPAGKVLKARITPLLWLLDRFEKEQGAVAPSLAALAPTYISQLPVVPSLTFLPAKNVLLFSYGPSWPQLGQVLCSARVDVKEWQCIRYM